MIQKAIQEKEIRLHLLDCWMGQHEYSSLTGMIAKLRQTTINFIIFTVSLSVPTFFLLNKFAPTGRISTKFDIWVFLKNRPRNLKFHHNMTKITGTLSDDRYKFLIIYSSVIGRKIFRYIYKEIKICSSCSITLFQNVVPFLK